MRAHINAAAGAALLTPLLACLDLDEEVITGVTTSYYEDAAGMEDAVNATYSTLRLLFGKHIWMAMTEQGTDLWRFAPAAPTAYSSYTPDLSDSDPFVAQIWRDLYWGINTANAVIGRSEGVNMPTDLRDQWAAEVRYLRALFYFLLVQTFGDVHLTLEETQSVQTETSRAPTAEIYEAIIADLEFAAAQLPVSQPEFGRITRGAAQHLLAKVYLTRAAPGDMASAADLARRVIDSGQYSLLPSFADIFDVDNQQNAEVIFAVRYSGDLLSNSPPNQLHNRFVPVFYHFPGLEASVEYGRAVSSYRQTDYQLALWDREKDRRYDEGFRTVWYANCESCIPTDDQSNELYELGDTALWMPGVEVSPEFRASRPYHIMPPSEYTIRYWPNLLKYMDPSRTGPSDDNGRKNVIVFRLAETHLILAEALLRDGKPAEALPYVNAVRRRAAKPGFEADMEITAEQLDMDFILDERGRELTAEHTRWFDLVRTGTLVERVMTHNPEAAPNIRPHHILRPIPQSAIDRTTSDFPQNPGY